MKVTEQFFIVMPFITPYKAVVTFDSVYVILECNHLNESYGSCIFLWCCLLRYTRQLELQYFPSALSIVQYTEAQLLWRSYTDFTIYWLSEPYIGWDSQTFAIRQCQQFVVVQNAVQVFHPFWIHVAVKNDPLALVDLPTDIVNDPRE